MRYLVMCQHVTERSVCCVLCRMRSATIKKMERSSYNLKVKIDDMYTFYFPVRSEVVMVENMNITIF
jgi:hypothetical protein